MIRKLYYLDAESKLVKHKVEVFEDDIVKVLGKETLYKIHVVNNSDISFNFGTCYILDIDTCTEGYETIPISKLVFVDREFYDPDHF
jgi:hypothetical protein